MISRSLLPVKMIKTEKVVVEINGDKITINGKPLDEYKDKDGDINVRLNKLKELGMLMGTQSPGWNYNGNLMI